MQQPADLGEVARQLGLARRRGYSPLLQERLQLLVQRGHDVLYRPPLPRWQRAVEFFIADFPRLVRSESGVMLASLLLFVVPLVASFVALQYKPELIHTLMPPQQVAQCIDGVLVLFDTQQKGLTGVLVDSKKQAVRCMGEETPQAPQQ